MKLLCICAQGLNKSRHAAHILTLQGHETRYGGIDLNAPNPLKEEDAAWADGIVFAHDRHQQIFHECFGKHKKEFVLGVTDKRENVPKQYRDLSPTKFHEQWTFPQVERALENLNL